MALRRVCSLQVHTAAVRYARRGRVVSITQTLGSDHVRSFFAVPMPWDKKRSESDHSGDILHAFGLSSDLCPLISYEQKPRRRMSSA